jgi:hypothetical protein
LMLSMSLMPAITVSMGPLSREIRILSHCEKISRKCLNPTKIV